MWVRLLGVILALKEYAFFLGAILVFIALTADPPATSKLKVFAVGSVSIFCSIAVTLALGEKVDEVELPLLACLVIAVLGVRTGLRWWSSLQAVRADNTKT